jgi:hypothetical protein
VENCEVSVCYPVNVSLFMSSMNMSLLGSISFLKNVDSYDFVVFAS